MTDTTGLFAAAFAALYAAHQVADHWIQTHPQACGKGADTWRGRLDCAMHVTTYTVTALVALVVMGVVTGAALSSLPVITGLAISAVTHYWADRRKPLRRLALAMGKDPKWLDEGGGLYLLDQSWHYGWLFVAALVIAA